MSRLAVTPFSLPAKYPVLQPSANAWDITWTAAGASFAEGAGFPLTGKEILLVKGGAAPQTVTISSVVDPYKRTGDITAYAVGIGEFVMMPQFQVDGWQQADGQLYFAANAADVSFLVLRLVD